MKQVPLNDTLGFPWAITDEDIVHAYESEPQYWQQDIDLPEGLGDEVDDGQDGEPREEDDPRQECLPLGQAQGKLWRRPAEKPAWLQQLCQRGQGRAVPKVEALPSSNGLAKVEAMFRGLGSFFTP